MVAEQTPRMKPSRHFLIGLRNVGMFPGVKIVQALTAKLSWSRRIQILCLYVPLNRVLLAARTLKPAIIKKRAEATRMLEIDVGAQFFATRKLLSYRVFRSDLPKNRFDRFADRTHSLFSSIEFYLLPARHAARPGRGYLF
jgi:hypothetical protein